MKEFLTFVYKFTDKVDHRQQYIFIKFINFNFSDLANRCFIGKVDPEIFDTDKYTKSTHIFKFITEFEDDLDEFFDDSVSQRAGA
jgi:hypothetical protein